MIEVKNLSKIYESKQQAHQALQDVSFAIDEGEFCVIVGQSGSGKSTLLSIIAGFLKPSSGEVLIENTPISKIPDHHATMFRRNHIGFVFQKFNLLPNLSVAQNVASVLIPSNKNKKEVDSAVIKAMQTFHIAHKKDVVAKNLSGGEQQRCAIARAIVNDPRLILADEPSANLDKKLTGELLKLLRTLKDLNKTVVIVTHDPNLYENPLFDRVITIDDGQIV
jgi:putative ABC transport system ATP-binding protein